MLIIFCIAGSWKLEGLFVVIQSKSKVAGSSGDPAELMGSPRVAEVDPSTAGSLELAALGFRCCVCTCEYSISSSVGLADRVEAFFFFLFGFTEALERSAIA